MTATMLPPSTATDRLEVVERQIAQCDEAIQSGAYGWDAEIQDRRQALMAEAAELYGTVGKAEQRWMVLRELGLAA